MFPLSWYGPLVLTIMSMLQGPEEYDTKDKPAAISSFQAFSAAKYSATVAPQVDTRVPPGPIRPPRVTRPQYSHASHSVVS